MVRNSKRKIFKTIFYIHIIPIFHLFDHRCENLLQIQFNYDQNHFTQWPFIHDLQLISHIQTSKNLNPPKTLTQTNKTANKTHPELTNYSLMIQTSAESQLILFNFTHPYHSLGFFYSRCFGCHCSCFRRRFSNGKHNFMLLCPRLLFFRHFKKVSLAKSALFVY